MTSTPAGTADSPLPNNTAVMEPKMKWGTVGAYVGATALLAVVNVFAGDSDLLLAALPDALEIFVVPLVPGLVAGIAAYQAKHQYRRAEVDS